MKSFWLALCLLTVSALAPAKVGAWVQEEPVEVEPAGAFESVGEGEEGEAEEAAEEEGPLAVLFRWINFAILFGGLGYLLRQPALDFFNTRQQEIRGGLERSQMAREDAAKRMREIDDRLADLSAQTTEISSFADVSARNERDRIVADAKMEARRAVGQSEAEVGRLARGMEREIREEIADRVMEHAERMLRSRLTDADQSRIVRRAVAKL